MLLWLSDMLIEINPGFSVITYITLRSILSALTALSLSLLLGPAFIRRLVKGQRGQPIRELGPESHFSKAGTPTMGGALIIFSIVLSTLLWADLANRYVWMVLFVTLGFGMIGWLDDHRKLVLQNSDGLPARWKYLAQSVLGLAAALFLYNTADVPSRYLAVALGSLRYPFSAEKMGLFSGVDVSVKDGGRQIEYEDQDPRIHGIFLDEIAKNGVESGMGDFIDETPYVKKQA